MLYHPKLDAYYFLEQKTASRRVREILEKRGFELVLGHHDSFVSRKNKSDIGNYCSRGLPSVYTATFFGITVRDHFDYFLSRWVQDANVKKTGRQNDPVTCEWLKDHRKVLGLWALARGRLWQQYWEANALARIGRALVFVVKYEFIRECLDGFLADLRLPMTCDEEWINTHKTENKPDHGGEPWKFFEPDAKELIIDIFRFERELLGYPNEI